MGRADFPVGKIKKPGDFTRMTAENPWFLITSEEICEIQQHLQNVKRVTPGDCLYHVHDIAEIINTVQQRLA
jgi:hypothetical protein